MTKISNKDFLKQFSELHGYLFCEICNRTDKPIYQCCHIYRRSQYGWHPEIDNPKNKFVGCQDCHQKFDSRMMPQLLLMDN